MVKHFIQSLGRGLRYIDLKVVINRFHFVYRADIIKQNEQI